MDALDQLAPPRPAMPKVSRVLFSGVHYVACLTGPGLIVQNHRTGRGNLLSRNHPQFADYLDAFETAIDADESNALCRALMTT